MAYSIEILDKDRNFRGLVRNTPALDTSGTFLKYSKRLSYYASCTFRIGTKDPAFTDLATYIRPFKGHIRIKRHGVTVWQGVIVDVPHRTREYIEVKGYTYLYLLTTILVKHSASVNEGDLKDQYRTFDSGTLAAAITAVIQESASNAGSESAVSDITVGTIENPNFPANYVTTAGAALTGTWTFSTNFTLQFSYHDVFYAISQLGIYSECDYELTNDLVFNFERSIGNKKYDLLFDYSNRGSIEDYDLPLYGEKMANEIVGVGVDNENKVLHIVKSDNAKVAEYGKIQGVGVYPDVKNRNAMTTRVQEELRLSARDDEEWHLVLNERAYPMGIWDVGDTVTVQISDGPISVRGPRRIVGYDVSVHTTGRERVKLLTNTPKDNQ